MNDAIPFEMLSAYVDGELEPDEVAAVERAMAADKNLRDRVRKIRETDAALRAALAAPLREAVPPRLRAAIDGGFAARRRRRMGRIALPVAAGIAAVIALGATGYHFHRVQLEAATRAAVAAQERERAILMATINHVLETVTSGQSVTWEVPETGTRGAVTPIRTYRSTSGHWCREFEIREVTASGEQDRKGLACRTGEREWQAVRAF
jgi:anti-sigma factor RsiW